MLAFLIHPPLDCILSLHRSTTAASTHQFARWRIHGNRKEVRRFGEVGHQPMIEYEVDQHKHVCDKDEEERDVENALVVLCAARGILLTLNEGGKGLVDT